MTAIIYDPFTEELSADTRILSGGNRFDDGHMKIWRGHDFVAAVSGDIGGAVRYFHKYKSKGTGAYKPFLDVSLAVMVDDMEAIGAAAERMEGAQFSIVLFYIQDDKIKAKTLASPGVYFEQNLDKPFVMGSGGDLCVGAVLAGVRPCEAIMLAATIDPGVSEDCITLNVRDVLSCKSL